jgi:hypothetical protein
MKRLAILLSLGLLLLAVPVFAQQIDDSFWVQIGEDGALIAGGGTGYNEGTWYVYPSGWINEWFYDHPFNPLRGKDIWVEFDWRPLDPTIPADVIVVVNWSTPAWSDLGYGETLPPLPGEVGDAEDDYIVRYVIREILGTSCAGEHFERDIRIWDYNPEWISIDVMGSNFEILNGVLIHECIVGTQNSTWGGIKAQYSGE